jgi:hypothetical protein
MLLCYKIEIQEGIAWLFAYFCIVWNYVAYDYDTTNSITILCFNITKSTLSYARKTNFIIFK